MNSRDLSAGLISGDVCCVRRTRASHTFTGPPRPLLQYIYTPSNPCTILATERQVGILRWARPNGCPWSIRRVSVLPWAWARCCPWDERTVTWVFLDELGPTVPLEAHKYVQTLRCKGQLRVLHVPRANRFPWDEGASSHTRGPGLVVASGMAKNFLRRTLLA